jgi:L-malate glycosyltransferase
MNILFVLPQLSTGGTERVVLELARHLDKSKFRVYAAYFFGGALEDELGKVCRGIFHVPKKPGFDAGAMWQLAKIIREKEIHLVNAHHYMPFFYSYLGSRVLNTKRLVYTEHSVAEVELITGVHKHIFNALLRGDTLTVGVSEEISAAFRDKFPSKFKKIVSIPNGIDVDQFSNGGNTEDIKARWGFSPQHAVIGNVANFRKVKNHACLIDAFHILNQRLPDTRLVLVGTGFPGDAENTEEACRQLIRSHGLESKVIFAGYTEDIPGILKGFDVFCLPSFSEGLPVSILEAMAAKVPVVGSSVRGIREVVFHNETGLLFPTDDSDALADSLERLLSDSDLRCKLLQNAFDRVNRHHALGAWVSQYQELFASGELKDR